MASMVLSSNLKQAKLQLELWLAGDHEPGVLVNPKIIAAAGTANSMVNSPLVVKARSATINVIGATSDAAHKGGIFECAGILVEYSNVEI